MVGCCSESSFRKSRNVKSVSLTSEWPHYFPFRSCCCCCCCSALEIRVVVAARPDVDLGVRLVRREDPETPSCAFCAGWGHLDPLVYVVHVVWARASALQQQRRVLSEVWPILACDRASCVEVFPVALMVRIAGRRAVVELTKLTKTERRQHHGLGEFVGSDGRRSRV